MRIKHALLCALTGATLLAAPVQASELTKSDVEQIVRDYLVKNPEILVEMSNALRAKQESQQAENDKTLIEAHAKQLFANQDPESGNPKGSLTVVEFFDYNCPYCKRAMPEIDALLAEDGNIRLVLREWPILSEGSAIAARAALAARKQNKYAELHNALMGARAKLDEQSVLRIAGEVGLDVEQLKVDMQSPEVEEHIATSLRLAEALGFNGTPSFVVGDQLIPGFVEKAQLAEVVAAARAAE